MQLNPSEISDLLKKRIEGLGVSADLRTQGTVVSVSDGIARIHGLSDVMQGEMLEFPNDVYGLALNLERDSVGAVILGEYEGVSEGDIVKTTGRILSVPVGPELIGRVVNALGQPIDGKGPIEAKLYDVVEKVAPGVIDRQSVSQPVQTGLKSIDSMVPIGRGQRELIIGDRQTGKTAIAIDAILNQRGKGMVCIYVAIGQKASTVANIRETLAQHGALDYTIIVSATAADSAPMQYIAPLAGAAIGEFFMYNGEDGKPASETNPGGHVLVIYDDLSKQAEAYRSISLLLRRPPGREAYPGDVFYLHSRLLERCAKVSDDLGGGSMTGLPIVETKANDVSAYIPTNVISITDGQIFLQSDLITANQRTAVDVGISVSRVGGAAQTKALKKVSGTLKISLAQYRSLESFAMFASDLDAASKAQLTRGAHLTELLKPPQFHPYSPEQEVVSVWTGTHGKLDDLDLKDVLPFEQGLLDYIDHNTDILKTIRETEEFTAATEAALDKAVDEFRSPFVSSAGKPLVEKQPDVDKAAPVDQEKIVAGEK